MSKLNLSIVIALAMGCAAPKKVSAPSVNFPASADSAQILSDSELEVKYMIQGQLREMHAQSKSSRVSGQLLVGQKLMDQSGKIPHEPYVKVIKDWMSFMEQGSSEADLPSCPSSYVITMRLGTDSKKTTACRTHDNQKRLGKLLRSFEVLIIAAEE